MTDTATEAAAAIAAPPRLIRWPEVLHLSGLTKSTAQRLIAKDEFPGPIRCGSPRIALFSLAEVVAWIEARRAEA